VTLFVTDESGEVVYRNGAAVATMQRAVATSGERGLDQLREVLRQVIRKRKDFPINETIVVAGDIQKMVAQLAISRIPGGFIVNWGNETAQAELATIAGELADGLVDGPRWRPSGTRWPGRQRGVRSGRDGLGRCGTAHGEHRGDRPQHVPGAHEHRERGLVGPGGDRKCGAAEHLQRGDRQHLQPDHLHRGADEPAGAERHHRGGARREAGKGFAVVANEVKELASGTAQASANINRMIETIQTGSAAAVEAIADIVARISELEEQQATIAAAVEEQSATAAGISDATGGLAGAAQTTADSVSGVRSAVGSLAGRARRLRELLADLQNRR
jgi:hypothetical protein